MALWCVTAPVRCTSVTPVARTNAATLSSAMPPPGRIAVRPAACRTSRAIALERGGGIAAYVERAVKRHSQRPCRADELARAVSIDLSVRAQRARHNALRARLLGPPDIFQQDREFGGRV